MLRTKEKKSQFSITSSKVEVTIFTPEQSGKDDLGPRSLTQSYAVSRSELDFRNFVQLPPCLSCRSPSRSLVPHVNLLLKECSVGGCGELQERGKLVSLHLDDGQF